MKKMGFITGLALLLTAWACNKVETETPQTPESVAVRFTLPSLPGLAAGEDSDLDAFVTLRSANGNPCKLRCGDKEARFDTRAGGSYRLDAGLNKS